MALKDNLKRIRKLKEAKVAEIAAKLDVTREGYYAYERGDYAPSEDFLDRLAKFYGISIKDFYGENNTDEQKSNDNTEIMKPLEEVYRSLVESNSEYRLVPKIILDNYEILPKSEIEHKRKVIQELIDDKNGIIKDLREQLAELKGRSIVVPMQPGK